MNPHAENLRTLAGFIPPGQDVDRLYGAASEIERLEALIKSSMETLQTMPTGGVGPDGAKQEELDAAISDGHPVEWDACYHASQQAWLTLNKALNP